MGVADSPFVQSTVGFFDIFGQAGRHNHYLQSFGTVDRQLELHVRALALSIELLKCAPALPPSFPLPLARFYHSILLHLVAI